MFIHHKGSKEKVKQAQNTIQGSTNEKYK